jgi:hypothetical protein
MFWLLKKFVDCCCCCGDVTDEEGERGALREEGERIDYNALLHAEGNRFIYNAVL